MTDSLPSPDDIRASFVGYVVERDPRKRWAWNVYHTRNGNTIARCNSKPDAVKVATALNIANVASVAASEKVMS